MTYYTTLIISTYNEFRHTAYGNWHPIAMICTWKVLSFNLSTFNSGWNRTSKTPTSSVCDGLIRVDGLVELTSVEEILKQLLNLRNTSRASDQHDVMYGCLVHLGVTKCLLNRLQSAAEQVGVQLLKPGTSDACVEVNAFKQRVYLNWRLKTTTIQCTINTRVRMILVLGYWILGDIHRYCIVLLFEDFFVTPNTKPIRLQLAPSTW